MLANAFKMLHQQRDGTSLGRIIGNTPAMENFRDMTPPSDGALRRHVVYPNARMRTCA